MRMTPAVVAGCYIAACVGVAGCDKGKPETAVRTLLDNKTYQFQDAQPHRHQFDIRAGHAFALQLQQTGADVRVVAGRFASDAAARRFRDEFLFLAPAHRSSSVTVEVALNERLRPEGTYVLTVLDVEPGAMQSPRISILRALAELSSDEPVVTPERQTELQAEIARLLEREPQLAAEWTAPARLKHAAIAYEKLADWKLAGSLATDAAAAYRTTRDTAGELSALSLVAAALIEAANEGSAEDRARQLDRARASLLEIATKLRETDEHYLAAHARNNAGLASQHLAESATAIALFREAAGEFATAGATISQALALQNIAWVHYELGQYRQARELYKEPLAIFAGLGEVVRRRAVLNNMALAHSVTGEPESAIASYRIAIDLQATQPEISELARSLHGLGIAYVRAGRPRRALPHLMEALPHRRATKDGRGQLATLIAIGNIHRELGDLDAALVHHTEAAALKLGAADIAKARYALALDLEASGRTVEGVELLDEVVAAELPSHLEMRGLALAARGRMRASTGKLADALADVDAAARVMEANGAAVYQPLVLLERGRVLRALGRHAAAERTLQEAVAALDTIRTQAVNPDVRASILASQAAVFEELVDFTMSAAATPAARLRALALCENWRARTLRERLAVLEAGTDQRSAGAPRTTDIETRLHDLYADLGGAKYRLDLLRDRARPQAEKTAPVEKHIEALRREIEKLEGAAAQAGASAKQTGAAPQALVSEDIARYAGALPAGTQVLVYSLGDHRSWLWTLSRGGIDATALPARATVEQLVRRAVDCLRNLDAAALSHGAAASDAGNDGCAAATSPLATEIFPEKLLAQRATRLLIVPDGSLHAVPFAALAVRDAGQPRFALARWEMATLPSLALHIARTREPVAGQLWARVGVVAPQGATDVQLLQATPLAPTLVAAGPQASQASASGEALRSERLPALAERLGASMPASWRGFDVLHFQTHAWSDLEDPNLSALEIPIAGAGSANAGGAPAIAKLFLGDIYRWRTDRNLVVLAACETGRGHIRAGEGTLSLAHGFMSTGARHVIASLWRIGDAATRDLMAEFYSRLQQQDDPVAALAAAQRHLIAATRWKHPYFWAGLVAYE